MILHYPVIQSYSFKQFEVAQINRKHILFHIIGTFQIRKYLRTEYNGVLNYFNQGVGLVSGGFCMGVMFHLVCYQHGVPV